MKLEDVTVSPDIIGWHGIGPTEVLKSDSDNAIIDLDTWVDENGIGESNTGAPVKKEFPATVVLLDDVEFDPQTRTRHADSAYIGRDGTNAANEYRATFDSAPPPGEYSAFFPHTVRHIRVPTPDPSGGHRSALEEYDLDDLTARLNPV